ncbi:MAG: hypothetical protein J6S00_03160 [Clostridia bacterium]|nr:hypothetical protein [Clostridia bacterium]
MKRFFRSFILSFVIVGNLALFTYGICASYVNIRRISYGEYVSAIEISKDSIRILDFYIKLK